MNYQTISIAWQLKIKPILKGTIINSIPCCTVVQELFPAMAVAAVRHLLFKSPLTARRLGDANMSSFGYISSDE